MWIRERALKIRYERKFYQQKTKRFLAAVRTGAGKLTVQTNS